MPDHNAEYECPICGPTEAQQHPRRPNIIRCANCGEWLNTPESTAPGLRASEVLAEIAALVDEATGYSVPYKHSRFMPIDSVFTNALKAALGVPHGRACATTYPPETLTPTERPGRPS